MCTLKGLCGIKPSLYEILAQLVRAMRVGGAEGAERGTVPSLAELARKRELENMTPFFFFLS